MMRNMALSIVTPTESQIQQEFFRAIRGAPYAQTRYKYIHSIPNGGWYKSSKSGYNPTAMRMVREGLTRGVWDVFAPIPISHGGATWHGLYIEFKRRDLDGLNQEQEDFAKQGLANGFCFAICRSSADAVWCLSEYCTGNGGNYVGGNGKIYKHKQIGERNNY